MTDLSSVSSTLHPASIEQRELDSINFHDSLRFFQEQLHLNGHTYPTPSTNITSSYEVTSKYDVDFSTSESKEEKLVISNRNLAFEETKSVSNCRISIPTVDTILESVRVLRAIQKSQEQRGTTWSLSKVLSSVDQNFQNQDSFEEVRSAYSEVLCESSSTTVVKEEKFSSDLIAEFQVGEENVNPDSASETNIEDILNTSNESTHFWPSNKIEVQKYDLYKSPCKLECTKIIDLEIPNTIENNKVESVKSEPQLSDGESNLKLQNFPCTPQNETLKNETMVSIDEISKEICLEKEINLVNHSYNLSSQSEDGKQILTSGISNSANTNDSEVGESFTKQLNSLSTNFSEDQKEKMNFIISEINSTLDKTSFQTNDPVSDLKKHSASPTSTSSLRPDSGHGSCSSYEVFSECSSPNHILECLSEDCDSSIAYSRPSSKEESKTDNTLSEWTTEWLESRLDTEDEDSRIREVPSSLSTASVATNIFEESSLSEKLGESRCLSSDLDAISGSNEEVIDSKIQDEIEVAETLKESPQVILTSKNISSSSPDCGSSENIKSHHLISGSTEVDNSNDQINDCSIKIFNIDTVFDLERKENPQDVLNSTNINVSNEIQNSSSKNSPEITVDVLKYTELNQDFPNSNKENINTEAIQKDYNKNLNVNQVTDSSKDDVHQTVFNSVENNLNNELTQNESFEKSSIATDLSKDVECNQDALNSNVEAINNNLEHKYLVENTDVKAEKDLSNHEINSSSLNSTLKNPAVENTVSCLVEKLKPHCNSNINGISDKIYSNEKELDLNCNQRFGKSVVNGTANIVATKKFITSSWDLVSIVKILYNVGDPQPPQVFPEDSDIKSQVFILSKGAFSQQPEGNYTILLKENALHVIEKNTAIISLPLKHADIHTENEDTLVLDNKMGRCLHIKCENKEDLLNLKAELELCSLKCWQDECINLVHYPLKCHKNIIVIDLGSCSTRAGILMDQPTLPALFFPSVCATNKTTGKHVYGTEALQPEARQNSTISFPLRPSVKIIKHSIDIDKVCGIFKMIFRDLKVDPTNYAVQVCLPRSLSISAQNALLKVLLEDLNVHSVSLAHQAILTLYAHNVSTGIVVDVGDRMDILPVIDGFIVEPGVTRLPYGGQRMIHHMKHALAAKHISLSNDIDSFVVQYITENLTYIAEDFDRETQIASAQPHTVRKSVDLQAFAKDENCFQYATLDDARFKVPEGLFNPDLWGLDCPGIHKLVQKAIQTSGVDGRKRLAENIYVSGGVTLTPGFVERLRKEVSKLNEPRIIPKVYASNYRYHSTYIGACRFARMDVFPQVCVNREEYERDQISSLKKFMLCV